MEGTGILKFDQNCIVKTDSMKLPTYRHDTRNIEIKNPLKFPNRDLDNLITTEDEIETRVHKTPTRLSQFETHNTDFQIAQSKIEQLQIRTNEVRDKILREHPNIQKSHTIAIMSLTVVITLTILTLVSIYIRLEKKIISNNKPSMTHNTNKPKQIKHEQKTNSEKESNPQIYEDPKDMTQIPKTTEKQPEQLAQQRNVKLIYNVVQSE